MIPPAAKLIAELIYSKANFLREKIYLLVTDSESAVKLTMFKLIEFGYREWISKIRVILQILYSRW